MPTFDDAGLAAAVAGARSWRGVLRAMGCPASSSSAMKAAKLQATLLGLDTTHFTGQRRWSDEELARAVQNSRSWAEVLSAVGLSTTGGGSSTAIRRHAALLELDTRHLNAAEVPAAEATPIRTFNTFAELDR